MTDKFTCYEHNRPANLRAFVCYDAIIEAATHVPDRQLIAWARSSQLLVDHWIRRARRAS